MLTDEERNHLLSIADTVASLHAVDTDYRRGHCLAAAERIRAIAAPRVAPSPTPGICAAIEQAAAWIELGEIGATPDGEALVATLRGFTRAPRVATVVELGHVPTVEATAAEGAALARRIGETYDLTTPIGRGRAVASMQRAASIIAGAGTSRGPIGEG